MPAQNSAQDTLAITPETKVAELLNAYPALEETLVSLAPAFKKLKNPVLKRTIARVTSLRQASRVGNIPLGELIHRLRSEAGISSEISIKEDEIDGQTTDIEHLRTLPVYGELDGGALLEQGIHPLDKVIKALRQMPQGQVYKLTTPFVPSPLIDQALQIGFASFVEESEKGKVVTWFYHKNA